jgi:hypothetical protein
MQVAIAARRASCSLFALDDQDALSLPYLVCWRGFHNLLPFHEPLLSLFSNYKVCLQAADRSGLIIYFFDSRTAV